MIQPESEAPSAPTPLAGSASVVGDLPFEPDEGADEIASSSPPGMSSTPGHDDVTSTARVPAFDHRMFPHIMDVIIESAPREALFPLSRTSKDMWARTARLIPTHIRVRFTEPDNANPCRDMSNNSLVIVKRVMAKGSEPSVVEAPVTQMLRSGDGWSFDGTKILDFEGLNGYFQPGLLDTFSAVHTVRLNTIPYWYISGDEDSIKRVVIRDYWRPGCSIPRTLFRCPDGVEKVVCNIHYHITSNMANFYLGGFSLAETVRDVVIIFTNVDNVAGASFNLTDSTAADSDAKTSVVPSATVKDGSIDAGSGAIRGQETCRSSAPLDMEWSIGNQFRPLGWLRDVFSRILHPSLKVKYTLVDAALVPPVCFGMPGPSLSPMKLEIGIIHQLAQQFEVAWDGRRLWEPVDWDAARKAIRVVTKDVYRDEIGEMDYRIETEW